MIQGRVNDKYEAIIPLTLYAANGSEYTFTAVIDTGSEAEIVASPATILLLQLRYVEPVEMKQADDEYVSATLFEGEVDWHGRRRAVRVVCTGESLLIGMGLLRGHQMNMDIRPGGLVQII